MNNRTLFNRGIKVWKLIILWFSIKHYYMTYYLGFPSCPEYACMINDVEMREKNIVYRFCYSIFMSLCYGAVESFTFYMMPFLKVYLLIYLYS